MKVKAAMIRLLEKRIVEVACVQTADLILVRQQELRAGEPDARHAACNNSNLAVADGVYCCWRDEEGVWRGAEKHSVWRR